VAPVGTDPVVATTTLPLPVLAERPPPRPAESASLAPKETAHQGRLRPRPPSEQFSQQRRAAAPPPPRSGFFFPFSFFGR